MKRIILAVAMMVSTASFATTVGLSTHPFTMNKSVVTTEFNSYLSSGDGMGITAKYFQRVNSRVNFDAGFGVTDGDRANRLFAGADYELFPDYGRQPRVSIKSLLETNEVDGDRINSLGFAPTLSKGFSIYGKEAFPFVALPMSVGLNTNEGTYETITALSAGITGRLPVRGFESLVGNIETNFNLRNSYTALVMGLSMPLQ
ncbi:MAG: hypothetical protein CME67_02655 [Halobacteriovoraceae bacterium]|nr:hypothetical protein [Peredibacter sp.]MBJ00105.1 hypothetical protein [Halobacteriovoraceae bacterium]|tara:strand:- start:2856 stop:3461 length:606 start_codon:yes stop_codon:yes gene_type:complete